MTPHLELDLSDRARVLAVGDVHGKYDMLGRALADVSFDPARDTLVMLGDLVDRGEESMRYREWIDREGVHRVVANHDILPRLFLEGEMDRAFYEACGCRWFLDLPRDEIATIARELEDAPVAITATTPGGRRVGFVHADCMRDWDRQTAAIAEGSRDRVWATDMSLWSRETWKAMGIAQDEGEMLVAGAPAVAGIDHVFHGHTPIAVPLTVGNRTWIDTGACYGGRLTVVDVDRWLDASPPAPMRLPRRLDR